MDPPGPDDGVARIHDLLRAKDDTQRFIGLALLKSMLDNAPRLRQDAQAVKQLWASLSPRFLDRLLRTGSNPSNKNAREMLDLAVSVLHTFAALLPAQSTAEPRLTARIPGLVDALLHSSDDTTGRILQLLRTLVGSPDGARVLVGVRDLSPLTEIAPAHRLVFDVLDVAFLNATTCVDSKDALSRTVDETVQNLASSFTGTDAVTLLDFVASLLRRAHPSILPAEPKWLRQLSGYIQALVASRPSSEARCAYTKAAAALLQAYPLTAPALLFADTKRANKPFAYLLINLILIDIRSSAPSLLGQLNTPGYSATSERLASAFDVVCIFVGHLVRSLEDESLEGLAMSPDSLLKIRRAMSDTMSVTLEHLRDRWDASVAGAMGLHPDARVAEAKTSAGSRRTLAWDSMASAADDDPLILAAVRALVLWLREDDNEQLRKEATGLIDMFMDLYRASTPEKLDFRSPVLVALEPLVTLHQGRELFLRHDGWQILSKDLTEMLGGASVTDHPGEASRGTDIVRILILVVEQEASGTAEERMHLITTVVAWDFVPQERPPDVQEFQVAVLQLCCTLLVRASGGMRGRYRHSIDAIRGFAAQLSRCIGRDALVEGAMQDVVETLDELSANR